MIYHTMHLIITLLVVGYLWRRAWTHFRFEEDTVHVLLDNLTANGYPKLNLRYYQLLYAFTYMLDSVRRAAAVSHTLTSSNKLQVRHINRFPTRPDPNSTPFSSATGSATSPNYPAQARIGFVDSGGQGTRKTRKMGTRRVSIA